MFLCLFRTLSKGGKLTMCNYVFITMVELQVHFSRNKPVVTGYSPPMFKVKVARTLFEVWVSYV